ncbi:MAG: undecaprenyldiphospho-muramoylpentapeptide beta-N-acetylglucosaminyltransferase [Bacteroidales bacterium]|nr:undecaprenyldiphospho-muramoylpentapeptide beta-N-acetylglucosaminyltransferase [Candidatus Cacconaster merdequi]
MERIRLIISGGGTGGHIFPAISIANAIKELRPDADILFVGAQGKMEMEKVPAAGYRIIGLPVAGLQRKLSAKNFLLPFKVIGSLCKARRIIKEFKPQVAVGVGGYASAPLLWSASRRGIPCVIQEQNSFAGLTNRILAKRARRICTAYEGMEKFFPADKILLTGNPIRKEIDRVTLQQKEEGYAYYGLDPKKKTVFIVGGSLGCGTLNRTMRKWVEEGGSEKDYQVIWQCGRFYKASTDAFLSGKNIPNLVCTDFIQRIDLAYAVADVIVSRAGAGTISELCVAGKATIFVPSPNVAEDHQTHNAMALVNKGAARIVRDDRAQESLIGEMESLLADPQAILSLESNILELGRKDAALRIAQEVLSQIE